MLQMIVYNFKSGANSIWALFYKTYKKNVSQTLYMYNVQYQIKKLLSINFKKSLIYLNTM